MLTRNCFDFKKLILVRVNSLTIIKITIIIWWKEGGVGERRRKRRKIRKKNFFLNNNFLFKNHGKNIRWNRPISNEYQRWHSYNF